MKCPCCHNPISFSSSLKIVNPLKYTCPQCKHQLRIDLKGLAIHFCADILGAVMTCWAIYMKNKGLDMAHPFLAEIIAGATIIWGALGLEWVNWKIASFSPIKPKSKTK